MKVCIETVWLYTARDIIAIYHVHGRHEFSPLAVLAQDTRRICFVVCKSAEGCARGLPGLFTGPSAAHAHVKVLVKVIFITSFFSFILTGQGNLFTFIFLFYLFNFISLSFYVSFNIYFYSLPFVILFYFVSLLFFLIFPFFYSSFNLIYYNFTYLLLTFDFFNFFFVYYFVRHVCFARL